MKKFIKVILIISGAVALQACNMIPQDYRGTFRDVSAGVAVKFKAKRVQIELQNGKVIKTKMKVLKFKNLLKAEPGLYLDKYDEYYPELSIIIPDVNTKKEVAGIVYFDAEYFFSRLDITDSKKKEVIEILHCEKGRVMLDTVSQTWQAGCPEGSHEYRVVRYQ